jgi:Fe-S-cluster-containing dehydrogenase component
MQPACVEACREAGGGAMAFGDLNDSSSEVAELVAKSRVRALREDLGTDPKVFYMGL